MRDFRADKVPRPALPPLPVKFQTGLVDLEIGAGQGLHAIQYCLSHPDRRLIALERTQTKFAAFRSRQAHHTGLENLLALRSDAEAFVSHFLPANSLERVFLLYPNPYPKAKHANLRWHRSPFMRFLHSRITSGGRLVLATNLLWYADEALDWLTDAGLFHLVQKRELKPGTPPRTHFEKKYLERGETCFDLVFEK